MATHNEATSQPCCFEAAQEAHSDRTDNGSFQRNMVVALTEMQQQLANLRTCVEDMKVTLVKHDALLRCGTVRRLFSLNPAGGGLTGYAVHRDHSSTLMSKREIMADYTGLRHARYQDAGACVLAAAEAWEFFDRVHRLMVPQIVEGVLYSRDSVSSTDPIITHAGDVPDARGGVHPGMVRFRLGTACVWELADDHDTHGVVNAHGRCHRVTLVRTAEGGEVAVDWGIAQFRTMPADTGLFIAATDVEKWRQKLHHALTC